MVSRNLRFRFTLVSYNILSQTLLNDHGYLYSSCNPKDLEWPRRGHRIVSELLNNQADIICLQEVESEHLKSLYQPKLARFGYECLYKKKTGYKLDGCAIFYKSKLFHLLKYKGIEFNRIDVTNLLNRDNVGIIAVLKPKIETRSKSSRLVIANTHLIFNPRRSDIRLAQLKYFLSELEEISLESYDTIKNERHHYPTIFCGDLNSTPESDVRELVLRNTNLCYSSSSSNSNSSSGNDATCLSSDCADSNRDDKDEKHRSQGGSGKKSSKIQPSSNESQQSEISTNNSDDNLDNRDSCISSDNGLNEFGHTIQFKSVYPIQNQAGQRYVSTFSSCIVDYIFYTPKLHLESYKELLTEEQLSQIGPLPNAEFPSDHLTLEAKFTLK